MAGLIPPPPLPSPLPLQYLCSCLPVQAKETRAFGSCALTAGSAPAPVCSCVLSPPPSSLCLPLWGLLASLLLPLEQWSCLTLHCYNATSLPRFLCLPCALHSPLPDNHRRICKRQRQERQEGRERDGKTGVLLIQLLHSVCLPQAARCWAARAAPGSTGRDGAP